LPPSERTRGKTPKRFNNGAESEGIKTTIHLDEELPAWVNADSRAGLDCSVRNQPEKASGTRRLLSESATPGIEKIRADLFFQTKGGNAHAACCLVLNDGAPMGSSFRSGHHISPSRKKVVFVGSCLCLHFSVSTYCFRKFVGAAITLKG